MNLHESNHQFIQALQNSAQWFPQVEYKDVNPNIPPREIGNTFSVKTRDYIFVFSFLNEQEQWSCKTVHDSDLLEMLFKNELRSGVILTTQSLELKFRDYRKREVAVSAWVNEYSKLSVIKH